MVASVSRHLRIFASKAAKTPSPQPEIAMDYRVTVKVSEAEPVM